MRFHVIALKTMEDMFSLRRTLLFLIVIAIVPFLGFASFAGGAPGGSGGDMFSSTTFAMQNQMVVGFFIVLAFMWIGGIPLVLLASVTCGDFISKEDQDGTLLLLVSKPVRRYEIIIGKFLAFMLNAMLLEAAALLVSLLTITSLMQIDVYIFNNLLSILPYMFLYSVFVAFIFGCIATSLSSLFKSRIKTIMILVSITILIFFGFMVMRGWLIAFGAYETYSLNYVDVNYHLGNSYLFFIDSSGFRMMPIYQGMMGGFTGTYDAADIGKLFDRDMGALPPSLEPKSYNTPAVSILIWTCIALLLLFAGMIKFERKEVR